MAARDPLREILGATALRISNEGSSRGLFFLAAFFRVMNDGLSERGTTRSPVFIGVAMLGWYIYQYFTANQKIKNRTRSQLNSYRLDANEAMLFKYCNHLSVDTQG